MPFLFLALPGPPAQAATSRTETARITFEGCTAITLRATIPRLTFGATQPITITLSLRNDSATTCGPNQVPPEARSTRLSLGPCGTLPMEVENAHRTNVYPGRAVYHCPAEFDTTLLPHATLYFATTWHQRTQLIGGHEVPRGHDRLVIDRAISFPLTLTRG